MFLFAANLGIMAKMSNIVSVSFLDSDLYLVAGPLFSRVRRPATSSLNKPYDEVLEAAQLIKHLKVCTVQSFKIVLIVCKCT